MRVILPPPSAGIGVILDTIRRAFIPAISQDEATTRLMLRSPNGTVYEVTVDDAGTLNTAVNDGKTGS